MQSYPEILQTSRLEHQVLRENFQAESSVSIQADLCSVQELQDQSEPQTVLTAARHHVNPQQAELLLSRLVSQLMLDLFNAIVSPIRLMLGFLGTE